MGLTNIGRIEAWTQLLENVSTHLKSGMCYHLHFIDERYSTYLKDEITTDLYKAGKSRFEFMFPKGEKQPRIKYINRKIKQLQNER